jgi:hypothetical protein
MRRDTPRGPATWQLLLLEDVHEDDHEQQVDEVHGFNQSHGQEEIRTCLVFDLGLTSNGRNGLATGQTVTNCRTDRTAAEGNTAADESTSNADQVFV